MATISTGQQPGSYVYAVIQRLSDGKYRVASGGAYEVYDAARWASYAHALAESPADSGKFALEFPEASGTYWVQLVAAAAAPAAVGDLPSFLDYPAYDPAATDDAGGGGGTPDVPGAVEQSVTVENADGDPIEGAVVRYAQAGATRGTDATDAAGLATVAVLPGTYRRTVYADGYAADAATVVVAGDASATVTLARNTVAPSDPGRVTLYARLYDDAGDPAEGETVYLALKAGPGTAGYSHVAGQESTATADASGDVAFANKLPGATYTVRRGDGTPVDVAVPADATDPVPISEFLGAPSASA